jgi:hypothetical protein
MHLFHLSFFLHPNSIAPKTIKMLPLMFPPDSWLHAMPRTIVRVEHGWGGGGVEGEKNPFLGGATARNAVADKRHSYYLPRVSWPSPVSQKNRVIFFASTPPPQPCATLTIGASRATLTIGTKILRRHRGLWQKRRRNPRACNKV